MTNTAGSFQIGEVSLYDKLLTGRDFYQYRDAFLTLRAIEQNLNRRFARMEEAIHSLIISALVGEPLLFVGDPGTGKSRLIRCFCQYLGAYPLNDIDAHPDYFEYLLTPFTEPGELFGYFEVVDEGGKRKIDRLPYPVGMMQSARVVYVDEVFNGSSAILNSLLAFMNERRFHDRGNLIRVRMEAMYGATNQIPETAELRAVYDRFFLRCEVSNIKTQDADRTPKMPLQDLLEKGWGETYQQPKKGATPRDILGMNPAPELLTTLDEFRKFLGTQFPAASLFTSGQAPTFLQEINRMIDEIRRRDLSKMSNRRVVKFVNLLLMHAIYDAVVRKQPRVEITRRQLSLWRYILDRRDEALEVHLRNKYTAPDFLSNGN